MNGTLTLGHPIFHENVTWKNKRTGKHQQIIVVVWSLSHVWLCNLIDCGMPGLSVLHCLWSLLKLLSIESMMPSNHLILCHPLLLLPSIFPSINSFPVSQLFASGGQIIGSSALASVLPMNIQGWFLLRLTGLSSLLSKGLSRVFSSTTVWKHQFFSTQPSLWSSSHIHTWLLEKPQLWKYGPLSPKWCFYSFNTLSRLVSFPSKEQASFNFMDVATVCSDFGA